METMTLGGAVQYEPARWMQVGPVQVPAAYGDVADEYRAAREGLVVVERGDRGLIRVAGADRATWLHNLVTNAVTTLDVHRGNYAFAVDVRGRVIFDLNVLTMPNELWLDVPRAAVPVALAHFDGHLFTEEVEVHDATDSHARLAVTGPLAAECVHRHGAGQLQAMPDLGLASFGGDATLFRHDLAGLPGFELIMERPLAVAIWNQLVERDGAVPCGYEAIDVLRIEAGIPWFGRDIDERVIPPETGQVERGISYHKGCYLGQEVIERMRAYGSMANHLIRVRMAEGDGIAEQSELRQDGKAVGRLTSLRAHPLEAGWVGLGYLKSRASATGLTAGEPPRDVEVLA